MGKVTAPVLSVENLRVTYPLVKGSPGEPAEVKRHIVVDGVTFATERGETLGLVGESGCGKTTLGRAVTRFLHPDGGSVALDGIDLVPLQGNRLRRIRKKIQMIFQNPYASLNPRMTVGGTLSEALQCAEDPDPANRGTVDALLEMVGLDKNHGCKFPHELSGGQRQRIAIARALAVSPRVIIADEPVSSLDVSVAAQIINLFNDMKTDLNQTMLFISHDLSVVRYIADRVLVMYRGRIVESGVTTEVFSHPLHPYTRNLILSIPRIEEKSTQPPFFERITVSPDSGSFSGGCRYAGRCERASGECFNQVPPSKIHANCGINHQYACFNPLEL